MTNSVFFIQPSSSPFSSSSIFSSSCYCSLYPSYFPITSDTSSLLFPNIKNISLFNNIFTFVKLLTDVYGSSIPTPVLEFIDLPNMKIMKENNDNNSGGNNKIVKKDEDNVEVIIKNNTNYEEENVIRIDNFGINNNNNNNRNNNYDNDNDLETKDFMKEEDDGTALLDEFKEPLGLVKEESSFENSFENSGINVSGDNNNSNNNNTEEKQKQKKEEKKEEREEVEEEDEPFFVGCGKVFLLSRYLVKKTKRASEIDKKLVGEFNIRMM
jgi:hypothetical protein